jgi:hypothetical protein
MTTFVDVYTQPYDPVRAEPFSLVRYGSRTRFPLRRGSISLVAVRQILDKNCHRVQWIIGLVFGPSSGF